MVLEIFVRSYIFYSFESGTVYHFYHYDACFGVASLFYGISYETQKTPSLPGRSFHF